MPRATNRFVSLSFGVVTAISVVASSDNAQGASVWDAAVVTCQELIQATGANDPLLTMNTPGVNGGFGMRHNGAAQTTVTMFCHVWIADNTAVKAIQLRYIDTDNLGFVRATFYRQAWTAGFGAAVAIASITSPNSALIPNVVGLNFGPEIINNQLYSYLVRVEMQRSSTAALPRALQVRLLDTAILGVAAAPAQPAAPVDCESANARILWTESELEACSGSEAVELEK